MAKYTDDIKKKVKDAKIEFLILNVLLILLGGMMIAFRTGINLILCMAIGIGLCIWGVIRAISYFRKKSPEVLGSFGLVQGCAMIGMGIYMLVEPAFFGRMIGVLLAIGLIIAAVVKFQYAFDFMKLNSKYWWIHLIIAVVMAGLGVLALLKPFGIANFIMAFIGISLIFSSLWDIASLIMMSRIVKGIQKTAKKKSRFVDAEAKDNFDVQDDN